MKNGLSIVKQRSLQSNDTAIERPLNSYVEREKEAILNQTVTLAELQNLKTKEALADLFAKRGGDAQKTLAAIKYETELEKLQIEMVRMQRWVQEKGKRIAVLFEGRDTAGKGGAIRRFTEHLNPRYARVAALPKPTEEEKGQWYFQRYMKQLPNRGEIVFFDRSWYNRAVVEPVNKFCTAEQYTTFMNQVPEFENMLSEDGVVLIKFWFSISKDEQLKRFQSRLKNPLKQWKVSPVDMKAQELWDTYTHYKEEMYCKTHNAFAPWIIVKTNNKQKARLESMRHVLSIVPYEGKEESKVSLYPNPEIIMRYHRKSIVQD